MKLIDTHCHIDSEAFDADRSCVLKMAQDNKIEKIIVPATTQNRWSQLLEICKSSDLLQPALGLHPVFIEMHTPGDVELLERQLEQTSVVALGEIGLDYYIRELDKPTQYALLDAQFSIAKRFGLPVILHCRKAYDELIGLIREHDLNRGIAHAFNGSTQQAYKLIDLGFKLGFGGMLTYPGSNKLRKLAKELPLSSIVLETDAPDLTVFQHRGKRNSPAYLPFVLESLVQIRKGCLDDIANTTYQTSLEVFA